MSISSLQQLQRRLTVAEMYFYTEVRCSHGHMVAGQMLSANELPTERRKNDQLKSSSSIQGSWSQSQVCKMYFYTELCSSLGHMVAEHWLSGTSASCAGFNTPTIELPTERRKYDQLNKSSSIEDSWSQSQAPTPMSSADTPRALIRSFSSEALASIDCFSSGVVNTCHSMVLKSRSMSLSFLVRRHGANAGLLFTDAAHKVLDDSSPSTSRCSSAVSRCCTCCSSALGDPKVSAGAEEADGGKSRRLSSSSRCAHSSKYESDSSLCHLASWCWSTRRGSVRNDDCFVGLIVPIVVFLLLIMLLIIRWKV